ncbi:unnamed protein product [Blepharisma stoltei]|uniref:Peptidase M14 domain-containing protein n=1 Tax=Blepharisma stoltei TaxID=1481888 RepID=A0AAU9J6S6_9CILI|nr:unnamed protein product [Blepharisma stoltei]
MDQISGDIKVISLGHKQEILKKKTIKQKLESPTNGAPCKDSEKTDTQSNFELSQDNSQKPFYEYPSENEKINELDQSNDRTKWFQVVYEIEEVSSNIRQEAIAEEIKTELEKGSKSDINRYYELAGKPLPEYTSKKINWNNDSNLIKFDSLFESGNLQKAIRVDEREYVLFIRPDTRAQSYKHWFYFLCKNQNPVTARFHIINFVKFDKLCSEGMKPVILSTKALLEKGKTWRRKSWETSFTETKEFKHLLYGEDRDIECYTYSFTYHFTYEKDTVKFAYSYPYTYADLSNLLSGITKKSPKIARVEKLADTLGGHSCDMITITNRVGTFDLNKKKRKEDEHSSKKGVVITARVHPGESPSSFIMQGLIKFLVGSSKDAKILRKEFIFCIVPMLNPDGVVHGNTRCSLLGVDLNRRWIKPNKILHPTIYHTKELIVKLKELNDVVMYCDLHAHAKKRNVFMYGCCPGSKTDKMKKLLSMVTPVYMAKNNAKFSYKNTHYRLEKQKEATARIVLFRQLGIVNSYTMECSFFGPEEAGNPYFSLEDLSKIGKDLARSCLMFVNNSTLHRHLHLTAEWLNEYKGSSKKDKHSEETTIDKDLEFKDSPSNARNEDNILIQAIENEIEEEIIYANRQDQIDIKQIEDTLYSESNRYAFTANFQNKLSDNCKASEPLARSMSKEKRSTQICHTKFISFTPNIIARSKTQNFGKNQAVNASRKVSLESISRKSSLQTETIFKAISHTNVQNVVSPLKGKKLGFELSPIAENKLKHPISNFDYKSDAKACILHKGLQCGNPIFSKNYLECLTTHSRNNSDNRSRSMKDLSKFLITSKLQ